MRFSRRFLAHRPLPSIMMATWVGNLVVSSSTELEEDGLEFKDLFLFFFKAFIDELDLLISYFLNLILRFKGIIFRNFTIFFHTFYQFVRITSDVPDGNLVVFTDFANNFDQFFATLFSKRRYRYSNDFSIIGRGQPQIRF